jgi:ribosomal protein L29
MGELHYKHGMSQLDNPLRIRQLRKDIARLRTLLRELDTQPATQA